MSAWPEVGRRSAAGAAAASRWCLRHVWPERISSRVVLIILLGLFLLQAVSMVLYLRERAQSAIRLFAESLAGRIVASVELLEKTPPGERAGLLPVLDSPTMWMTLGEAPPALPEPAWQPAPKLHGEVRRHLAALGDRPLEVRMLGSWHEPWEHWRGGGGPPVPDLLPSRRKLAIVIGLRDGSWLTATIASDITSLRWIGRMLLWLGLTGLIIILFAWWAARRATRPLTAFAEAADRLGVDVAAPPLAESGPPELQKAALAFNRMQARIRRLVDDRTQMLAAISHDLRTVLTRLRLRVEFIEDAEQQAKAAADLDEMRAMLDETLAFARDDGTGEARVEVDLAALVQSLCDDLADTGQPVAYAGPDRLPFAGRPLALRRALANLIDNAVTYGGRADVTLERTDGEVELVVADRGPGIPAGERERVFAPFYRLEPSRSRETGGSGLGLAVARTIVHRHGGQIGLEDRPGGGLAVRLRLPDPAA